MLCHADSDDSDQTGKMHRSFCWFWQNSGIWCQFMNNFLYFCIKANVDDTNMSSPRMFMETIYEPPHDKTNAMACAPSEDSDQPGHPWRELWSLAIYWAHSEDSNQTGCSHFVGFVMRRLNYALWRTAENCLITTYLFHCFTDYHTAGGAGEF